jgi:hypothetical protein
VSRKPSTDRNLRKIRAIFFIFLIFFLVFTLYKKLFILAAVTLAAGFFEFITNKNELVPNLGHVFFISMLFARLDSIWSAIIITAFAGIIPSIMRGTFDMLEMILYPSQILAILAFAFLPFENIVLLGIALSVLCYGFAAIATKMAGVTLPEILVDIVSPMILNILYFASFAQPLSNAIGMVISS